MSVRDNATPEALSQLKRIIDAKIPEATNAPGRCFLEPQPANHDDMEERM
jgi:hypothetical protein